MPSEQEHAHALHLAGLCAHIYIVSLLLDEAVDTIALNIASLTPVGYRAARRKFRRLRQTSSVSSFGCIRWVCFACTWELLMLGALANTQPFKKKHHNLTGATCAAALCRHSLPRAHAHLFYGLTEVVDLLGLLDDLWPVPRVPGGSAVSLSRSISTRGVCLRPVPAPKLAIYFNTSIVQHYCCCKVNSNRASFEIVGWAGLLVLTLPLWRKSAAPCLASATLWPRDRTGKMFELGAHSLHSCVSTGVAATAARIARLNWSFIQAHDARSRCWTLTPAFSSGYNRVGKFCSDCAVTLQPHLAAHQRPASWMALLESYRSALR